MGREDGLGACYEIDTVLRVRKWPNKQCRVEVYYRVPSNIPIQTSRVCFFVIFSKADIQYRSSVLVLVEEVATGLGCVVEVDMFVPGSYE